MMIDRYMFVGEMPVVQFAGRMPALQKAGETPALHGRMAAVRLSFDVADGDEAGDAFGESGAFGGEDDLVDVFVGGACFFGEAGETDTSDVDAAGFHVLFEFLAAEGLFGFFAGHGSSGAVGGGVECLIAGGQAGEEVRAGFHGAADDDGLPGFLVDFGQIGVAGAESAGGAFAVDQEAAGLAVDVVFFDFGGVVADVVDLL